MKIFWYLSFILLCNVSYAGVHFTAHPGYDPPAYFSGTNARAFFKAEVTSPDVHIQAAELLVGGEVVVSKSFPILGPPTKPAYLLECKLAAMFDSNHFTNGQSIEVKMRVQTGGTWYEETYDAPSRNHCLALGLDYYEIPLAPNGMSHYGTVYGTQGATAFSDWMTGIGYDTTLRFDQWSVNDLESELNNDVNLFMYCGHSTKAAIYSGEYIATNYWGHWVGSAIFSYTNDETTSIFKMRRSDVGYFEPIDPLPPFNDGFRPPLNVAFILSCSSASDSLEAQSYLFPYFNGYGKYLENQAVVGFTDTVPVSNYWFLSDAFGSSLAAGYSVEEALYHMTDEANNAGILVGSGSLMSNASVEIVGDAWTVIKNVYNPGTRLLSWYREVTI